MAAEMRLKYPVRVEGDVTVEGSVINAELAARLAAIDDATADLAARLADLETLTVTDTPPGDG